MKRVEVIKPFRDIEKFSVVHAAGEILNVGDTRAAHLVSIGLAKEKKTKSSNK